jgi:hypothetical protein
MTVSAALQKGMKVLWAWKHEKTMSLGLVDLEI